MDKVFCSSVWFATAQEQKAFAIAKGVNPKNVYTDGDGAETFETCVGSFRDGGRLGLVGGLYILGQDSDKLKARLAVLRKAKITPYDFESGETDGAKLYAAAISSIMGSKKFKKDRKKHRRISAKGGHGKGASAEQMRHGIAIERVIVAVTNAPELTWERKEEILGISEATLRRHYYQKQ